MSAQGALIDLGERRDLGQIMGATFRLYGAYFWVFAIIAFAVVIPVDVLIYGVAGERLWNSPDWGDSLPLGAAVAIFGAAFVISLLAAMFAAALAVPLEVAGYLLDTGPLVLLGQTIADGMSLSFAALAGTLLYFAAKIR